MDYFDNDYDTLDFASGVKKDKPKDLYNILETMIDSMGIVEPERTKPMGQIVQADTFQVPKMAKPFNQVVQANTFEVPEMAKPIDINKTHEDIGNLFTNYGQSEILKRQKEFERQQKSNQTFGYRNIDYSPTRDNQRMFITASAQQTPAASQTVSWYMPNTAEVTGQGAIMGGVVSGAVTSQNTAVPQQTNTITTTSQPQVFMSPVRRHKSDTPEIRPARLPQVTLSPTQIERSIYIANRLIDEGGFTPEQAAGIVGNLIHESQLDHQARGPRHLRWGHPMGIAQWLHPDRKRKFFEKIGVDVSESTTEQQTDFLLWELKHSHRNAANFIRQAESVNGATDVTRREYEKPGEREANDPKRKAYSYQVYDRLP